MPKLPTMGDMGGLTNMAPQGATPKIPSPAPMYDAQMDIGKAVQNLGNTLSAEFKAESKEREAEEVNRLDVEYRSKADEAYYKITENKDDSDNWRKTYEEEMDKTAAEMLASGKLSPGVREKLSNKWLNSDRSYLNRLETTARGYREDRRFGEAEEQVHKSLAPIMQGDTPPEQMEETLRQTIGNIKAMERYLPPNRVRQLEKELIYGAGPKSILYQYGLREAAREVENNSIATGEFFKDLRNARPYAGEKFGISPQQMGGNDVLTRFQNFATSPQLPGATPEDNRARPQRLQGELVVPKAGEFEEASYLGASGPTDRGSMPYGVHNLSEQGTGSRIAAYYAAYGLKDPGISFNLGSDDKGPISISDPKFGVRSQIQIHMANTDDVDKIISEGCLAIAPSQYETAARHLKAFMKENPGAVLSLAPAPPGEPHKFRVLTKEQAATEKVPSYTPEQAVENFDRIEKAVAKADKKSPDVDYTNAKGPELSQGIYRAFRNLGYTDFGAKTMLAEIHREHGGDFKNDGKSAGRRPFGFEWEPSPDHKGQINFGFINSTGERTAEIIKHLDEKGLVSYDAQKTSLNPRGIRVEHSQRALDAMAEWYDKDMREKGARDPNAIIGGADPRKAPDLFRDPNYKDVTDAHRRMAAYIQWQHPEIYGGKYRYGIAGERHYNMMLANRRNLDNLIKPDDQPVRVADARMNLGGPKGQDEGRPAEPFDPGSDIEQGLGELPPPQPERTKTPYEQLSPRARILSHLSPEALNKLENVARRNLSDSGARFETNAVAHAARTGEDLRHPKTGETYAEWAKVRQPQQLAKGIRKIEEAKRRFNAMADIGYMSDDDFARRLDDLQNSADPNDLAANIKLERDMLDARRKADKIHRDDGALGVSGYSIKLGGTPTFDVDEYGQVRSMPQTDGFAKPHPYVAKALEQIKGVDGEPNGIQIVKTPEGQLTINTSKALTPLVRQKAWDTLISARLAAQENRGTGTDFQRAITKYEALKFLGKVPSNPDDFGDHWKGVADRIEKMVGPQWAPKVMQDIKDFYIKGEKREPVAQGDIDSLERRLSREGAGIGSSLTARSARARDMERTDGLGRMLEGAPVPVDPMRPTISPMSQPAQGAQKAITPPANAPTVNGVKTMTPQPNEAARKWVLEHLDDPAAQQVFTAKYGRGAWAAVVEQSKKKQGWFR